MTLPSAFITDIVSNGLLVSLRALISSWLISLAKLGIDGFAHLRVALLSCREIPFLAMLDVISSFALISPAIT